MGWNRKKAGLSGAISVWRILFWSTLVGMLAMLYAILFMPAQYTSQASIYVSDAAAAETITPTGSAVLSENYAQSYLAVIESEQTYKKVKKALSSGMTTEMLHGMISAEQVGSTAIFTISANYKEANSAQMMADAMADAAVSTLESVGVSAAQLDDASAPVVPAAPNLLAITLLSMAIAAVLRLLIMVIAALSNRSLRGREDWEASFDIPVLAEIPERDVR
ncbi:MAG: Wzz/FepE/Etk N-terminal domain-containing protein [Eubacteriales bacterium]|nr:Wzz/FepE/Etk N-terminal domain-containing protein [Eubacteriales bacterium]